MRVQELQLIYVSEVATHSTDRIRLHVQTRCQLFDVKHLVDKTIEFVHAFLENFETAKQVLRDSTRVVVVIVLAY